MELEKALNIVGDYRLSTNINAKNWALSPSIHYLGTAASTTGGSLYSVLNEYDYTSNLVNLGAGIAPLTAQIEGPTGSTAALLNSFGGTLGSASFGMATNLETTNGVEISGLNAEEQSDIALMAQWHSPQVLGNSLIGAGITGGGSSNFEVYTYYDAMLILRENNVVELIQ